MPTEWQACLDAWIALAEAYLSLSDENFLRISKEGSLPAFLLSYTAESASILDSVGSPQAETFKTRRLHKDVYLLSYRLLDAGLPPESLLQWEFLADLSKLYKRSLASKIMKSAWERGAAILEKSLSTLKLSLVKELESKVDGKVELDQQLKRLNHLLHTSPQTAAVFMAGSDFLDALISRYKIMNPPLRQIIISTTYLCLIGLTEGPRPNFASLIDQLYSLKSAAEAHKAGPTSANDSLVVELVSVTPILEQLRRRSELNETASGRATSVLAALEVCCRPGAVRRPNQGKRRKGKVQATGESDPTSRPHGPLHVHRLSLISQVQDLFPDLGSGFVVKLLDEYEDNAEVVISHLLEDSLPSHLQDADSSEIL